jgi:hypothetical protein
MKRLLRFVIVLAISLALVPFLPLYVERTMTRSWRVDHVGDVVDMGWQLTSLSRYWSDYQYLRPEQEPAFWFMVNLVLALVYALVVALGIDLLLALWKRRTRRG